MPENRLIELLTRKMAGEASDSELHELDEMLSEHPDAIDTEEIFTQIWNAKVQEEDVNYFYKKHKKKYQDQFESTESLEAFAPRESWFKKHRFTSAAIFSLLTLTCSAYYIFSSTQKTTTATVSEYTHIVAGKGIRKAITLPDGTKVWLNGDSKLSYNAKMNEEDTRRVSLTGEAFFDVAHDKEHPFIIRTDKVSIKVLGTAFNVSAYPNDKKCETTLLRGSIELTVNDDSKQKFLLKPAEKFALINEEREKTPKNGIHQNEGGTLVIEHVTLVKVANKEYVAETSWTDNTLIFDNESLEDIATKLERWYNVKITISGQSIGKYRFTGAFENETVEQALSALQIIKSFNFKINENDITIY